MPMSLPIGLTHFRRDRGCARRSTWFRTQPRSRHGEGDSGTIDTMNTFQRAASGFNALVKPLINAPIIGKFVSSAITEITYTGRKSGKEFSIPVGYKRSGDQVTIGVAMPDKKSWWRNFYPDGGPISIELDGATRTGHAVTHKDGDRVYVSVQLDSSTTT